MNSSPTQSQKSIKAFRILYMALIGLLIVSGIIAFTVGFEPELRYFKNSPLTIPLAVAAAATAILALSSFFLFKRKKAEIHRESPLRFVAMLPMIAILRLIMHISVNLITSVPHDRNNAVQAIIDPWMIAILVTAVFVVIYFLAQIFKMNKALELISGFLQILFCIFVIAKLYLDLSVEINSPIKLLLQFSAAAIILCTMADMRRSLDMCSAPLFCASRLLMLACGVTNTIALFAEIVPKADKYGELYSVYSLIFITCAIKAAVELFTFSLNEYIPEDNESNSNSPNEASCLKKQEEKEAPLGDTHTNNPHSEGTTGNDAE